MPSYFQTQNPWMQAAGVTGEATNSLANLGMVLAQMRYARQRDAQQQAQTQAQFMFQREQASQQARDAAQRFGLEQQRVTQEGQRATADIAASGALQKQREYELGQEQETASMMKQLTNPTQAEAPAGLLQSLAMRSPIVQKYLESQRQDELSKQQIDVQRQMVPKVGFQQMGTRPVDMRSGQPLGQFEGIPPSVAAAAARPELQFGGVSADPTALLQVLSTLIPQGGAPQGGTPGQPPAPLIGQAVGRGSPQGTRRGPVTPEIAQAFLQKANGDKNLARQMALQAGFSF